MSTEIQLQPTDQSIDASDAAAQPQDKKVQTTDVQRQTLDWLIQHADLATHAITVTYRHAEIHAFLSAFSDGSTPKSAHMQERYKKGMLKFSNALDRKFYGHASSRFGNKLFFVPVIEGLASRGFPHWHCVMGVSRDRWNRVESVVSEEWRKVPFAGSSIKIEPIFSSNGWLEYITKCARYVDRQSVYWEGVRVPNTATIS